MSDEDTLLKHAVALARAGKRSEAYELVGEVLARNPDNAWAWTLRARLAEDPSEIDLARREVLRLKGAQRPSSPQVRSQPTEDDLVQRAAELTETGHGDEAREIINQVLHYNPNNASAWVVMAQLAQTRQEAIQSLEQVLRLEPDHAWAKEHLERFKQEEKKARRKGPLLWLPATIAGLVTLLCVLALVFAGPFQSGGQPTPAVLTPGGTSLSMSDCQALLSRAMQLSSQKCQQIGVDQVCYGHYTLDAQLVPDVADRFALIGDVVSIESLQALQAAPLDIQNGQWGIAVFKLQANLPRTVPGQAVTLLAFGNTSVENASGDMQAFYFSTGMGGITCQQVPFEGILINAPEGTGLNFQANGVDFQLTGSALLDAQSFGDLILSVLSGDATVSAAGQEQQVGPGQQVTVPLGGENGTEAVGPPSEPQSSDGDLAMLGCILTGLGCPPGEEVAALIPTSGPMTPTQPTDTPSSTDTPVPLPTGTSAPVATGNPTNTPVPVSPGQPTNTSVPVTTDTPVPTATETVAPLATDTPVPAATNTPGPTDTPVPTCDKVSAEWQVQSGKTVKITIKNTNFAPVLLTNVTITWPVAYGNLTGIQLPGQSLWDGIAPPTFFSTPVSGVVAGDGAPRSLMFTFDGNKVEGTGYTIVVSFDIGCVLTVTHYY